MANQPRASSSPIPEHGLLHDEWFENFPQNSDGFWKTAEKSETESPENEADKDKLDNLGQESQEISQQPDADQHFGMTEQEYNEAMQEASQHFAQTELEQQGYQVTAPETEPQQELSPEIREELSGEIMTEYANDNQPQPEPERDMER